MVPPSSVVATPVPAILSEFAALTAGLDPGCGFSSRRERPFRGTAKPNRPASPDSRPFGTFSTSSIRVLHIPVGALSIRTTLHGLCSAVRKCSLGTSRFPSWIALVSLKPRRAGYPFRIPRVLGMLRVCFLLPTRRGKCLSQRRSHRFFVRNEDHGARSSRADLIRNNRLFRPLRRPGTGRQSERTKDSIRRKAPVPALRKKGVAGFRHAPEPRCTNSRSPQVQSF